MKKRIYTGEEITVAIENIKINIEVLKKGMKDVEGALGAESLPYQIMKESLELSMDELKDHLSMTYSVVAPFNSRDIEKGIRKPITTFEEAEEEMGIEPLAGIPGEAHYSGNGMTFEDIDRDYSIGTSGIAGHAAGDKKGKRAPE